MELKEKLCSGELVLEIILVNKNKISTIYYFKYNTDYGNLMYTAIEETCFK